MPKFKQWALSHDDSITTVSLRTKSGRLKASTREEVVEMLLKWYAPEVVVAWALKPVHANLSFTPTDTK